MEFITLFGTPKKKEPTVFETIRAAVKQTREKFTEQMQDLIEAEKNIDYVIVDTAGRLHTKHNLMAELEKMTRIAKREVPGAPHEVLLIIDATTGQNGLTQAREFTKSAGVTGLVLTKLDGTAKGGVVTAIAKELKIPIRFVGVGEKIDDFIEFSADDFVESLFAA